MRGYFAIGAEGISKAANVGALLRTAHAFGASFVFTVGAATDRRERRAADTSDADHHLPLYAWSDPASMALPAGCVLVGIELTEDAIELPSFRHPLRAAYVLGPERGSLSPSMVERCAFVVKIPTSFCINVSVAGAVVMYDRMISLGRYAERPVRVGGPHGPAPAHVHGKQKIRNRRRAAEPAAG